MSLVISEGGSQVLDDCGGMLAGCSFYLAAGVGVADNQAVSKDVSFSCVCMCICVVVSSELVCS